MRTTIRISDDLYRDVKALAARSGRTIAAVLEDAVRRDWIPVTATPPGVTPFGQPEVVDCVPVST